MTVDTRAISRGFTDEFENLSSRLKGLDYKSVSPVIEGVLTVASILVVSRVYQLLNNSQTVAASFIEPPSQSAPISPDIQASKITQSVNAEILIEPNPNDWNNPERQVLTDIIATDIDYLHKILGPNNKPIKKIHVSRLTDDLRKQWGWDSSFVEGTSCQRLLQECTMYLSGNPQKNNNAGDARSVIAHGLVHALYGGWSEEGFSQINGGEYVFGKAVQCEGRIGSGASSPDLVFSEETLANVASYVSEKQLWKNRNVESHGVQKVLGTALEVDRNFFLRLRQKIESLPSSRIQCTTIAELLTSISSATSRELWWIR